MSTARLTVSPWSASASPVLSSTTSPNVREPSSRLAGSAPPTGSETTTASILSGTKSGMTPSSGKLRTSSITGPAPALMLLPAGSNRRMRVVPGLGRLLRSTIQPGVRAVVRIVSRVGPTSPTEMSTCRPPTSSHSLRSSTGTTTVSMSACPAARRAGMVRCGRERVTPVLSGPAPSIRQLADSGLARALRGCMLIHSSPTAAINGRRQHAIWKLFLNENPLPGLRFPARKLGD